MSIFIIIIDLWLWWECVCFCQSMIVHVSTIRKLIWFCNIVCFANWLRYACRTHLLLLLTHLCTHSALANSYYTLTFVKICTSDLVSKNNTNHLKWTRGTYALFVAPVLLFDHTDSWTRTKSRDLAVIILFNMYHAGWQKHRRRLHVQIIVINDFTYVF